MGGNSVWVSQQGLVHNIVTTPSALYFAHVVYGLPVGEFPVSE